MAQHVQNLFKLKMFYDKMNFGADQCLEITKAIFELTDSYEGSGFVKILSRGGWRFEDTVMVLYEKDRKIFPSHHN